MRKTIISLFTAAAFLTAALPARAEGFIESLSCNFRFGYMLGGTAPVGMPATIRSLDSYRLEPCFTLGVDVSKQLAGRWGLATGLRLENKGMNIKATVKNYHMAFVQGGSRLEGYFTGGNHTEAEEWMFTVPVLASYAITDNLHIKAGPYVSVLTSRKFEGYAHDGYLREGDPTGTKAEIGNDETNRGEYDFSNDMRRVQLGVEIGADYYWGKHWGAFAGLTWGLTGVFRSSFDTIEQTLYPIYGSVGLCYRLK